MNDNNMVHAMYTKTVIDQQLPENQRGQLGGFWIRPMSLAYGQVHDGHAHWIDHVSNITKPPVRIDKWNMLTDERETIDVLVPCKIKIPAQTWHKFTALAEGGCEWECWFSQKLAEEQYDMPVPWNQEKQDWVTPPIRPEPNERGG